MKRFVGKFIGGILGFTLAGPLGALAGLVIGHLKDVQVEMSRVYGNTQSEHDIFYEFPAPPKIRLIFAQSIIVLGAKLAKIDGPVTHDEVLAFRKAFRSHESHLDEIGRVFDSARNSADGYEPYAARLAQIFGRQNQILEEILIRFFFVAISDSPRLARQEVLFLRRVGVIFGFDEQNFLRIALRAGVSLNSAPPSAPKRDTAYDVLGLPTTATDEVVKRTYRALIRKHHPDKLVAAGLPADRVSEATEKVKTINAAYSEICKMRSIK